MADGTRSLDFGQELVVDLFAGGGGASLGIEQALGRSPDIAVNHDADALAMHEANHPTTTHLRCDVFEVDPAEVTRGQPVGLLWASPDCKHFSKAKGGKPRSKKIRSLAWVVVKWAAIAKPRVIMLENVEEFVTWGPLAKNGQPDPKRKGDTFRRWIARLRNLGYKVEWRELRACDYGTPTIRKRFFLVARCDGRPIEWPKPTHAKPDSVDVRKGKLLPWRTAAECIDFSLPCPSIFLTKEEARAIGCKRPLAPATMRRIARGVQRFVLDAARPFIVGVGGRMGQSPERGVSQPVQTITAKADACLVMPVITEHANASNARSWRPDEPLRTQCAEVKGGHFALASAFLTKYRADNAGSDAQAPFPTITANGESKRKGGNPPLAVVAAHLEQANGGFYDGPGRSIEAPAGTVCAQGSMQRLVASSLVKLRGTSSAADAADPLHTVSAQGFHHGLVTSNLMVNTSGHSGGETGAPIPTITSGGHIAEVRAFLTAYYGNEKDGRECAEPMGTVVSRERFGLVTVEGTDYAIADIGLRMLTPRELFRAQGFPESYVIDRGADGRKLPKDAQVRMCGNSVCPPLACALVAANLGELIALYARQAA